MQANISSRLNNLRTKIIEKKLSAILISKAANRFYLTGWLGDSESGYLLITTKKAYIITDSRYTEEVVNRVVGFELREYGQDDQFWLKLFKEAAVEKIGFESSDLSIAELKKFKKLTKATFLPCADFVETLRAVKDNEEINLIKRAIKITEKSFEFILKNLKPGLTEKEIAWELEKFMRELGASKNAWDNLIVASGQNSSMIHYAAENRKVRKGDIILLDWGCYYRGYSCDISRVVFLGTPNRKQAESYNLVLEAQEKSIQEVRPGARAQKIDLAAREFLKEKTKYYFKHAIGHGVGIEVHELPRVNEKSKDKLETGNIITIEPGIYEPLWGGIRIEDMVLVTEKGSVLLTKIPKKLDEVVLV